jgi:hypothetical protein
MPTRNKQTNNSPKRKSSTSGRHHRVSATHNAPSRKKRNGRKTVKSSSRIRAQRAGQADMVLPGRRGKSQGSSAIDENDEEVYGVLLSERRRLGEAIPSVPEPKTKTTQSSQPKKTPRTGVAKRRRS